jgi:phosphopantetheinyl transferase
MPLFNIRNIKPTGLIGMWNIKEAESYFLQILTLSEQDHESLAKLKGRRRLEWLSIRVLLKSIEPENSNLHIQKDEFGKPHIKNKAFNISISHSNNLSAVVLSGLEIGLDIQKEVSKIHRIKHKYLHQEELDDIPVELETEYLHFYWGAKESMYKAYGRKKLRFAEQIRIKALSYQNHQIESTGTILAPEGTRNYEIRGERLFDYYLVYAYEV